MYDIHTCYITLFSCNVLNKFSENISSDFQQQQQQQTFLVELNAVIGTRESVIGISIFLLFSEEVLIYGIRGVL